VLTFDRTFFIKKPCRVGARVVRSLATVRKRASMPCHAVDEGAGGNNERGHPS